MNKKGMTLVELIAVIAIIGILAIMITPGIMAVRNNVLESSLKSKVSQIENAAKEYGQEHINELKTIVDNPYNEEKTASSDCIYRTVAFLVNSGYLTEKKSYYQNNNDEGMSEARSDVINPVTGESMNDNLVCIRFDNNDPMRREIVAYLVETE